MVAVQRIESPRKKEPQKQYNKIIIWSLKKINSSSETKVVLELQPKVRKPKISRVGKTTGFQKNRISMKCNHLLYPQKKNTIQPRRYLESESSKKGISENPQRLFHQKIAAPKRSYSSGKNQNSYMFRPNILPKKVWVPTKRKSHFFGPTWWQKSMSAKQ